MLSKDVYRSFDNSYINSFKEKKIIKSYKGSIDADVYTISFIIRSINTKYILWDLS